MKHLAHFSWFKPAVEDMHFERDAKEEHIKQRIIDLTDGGTGILKGATNEIEVYVHDSGQFLVVKVKTGEAYIIGEKIEITSEQTVNLDDVETEANIIWLKYKLVASCDSNATRLHPLTGESHVVWWIDSFELGATKESQYTESDDDIKLARVAKVGSELKVTHDYRSQSWLKIDGDLWANYVSDDKFYVGGPAGTGKEVLVKQSAPPVPTNLDLSTGWDDVYRKTGESAGLISFRPAYIKAEFGDKGQGTASGNNFTYTSNRVGDWIVDEWVDHYLTCADGNSWKVVSNTADTLTLETGATPVSGQYWLGPNAAGYKFVIQTLDPVTEVVVAEAEEESQAMASPARMEFMFHNLTPDIKYKIKVASKGGWFQDEWSNFCTAEEIIAGGAKEIPDACGDVLVAEPIITAEDDGIRINWSVKEEYASKVAGFEICWTDDGSTTPDFDNKNHRKVFTDRNYVVLPAKLSSEDDTVTVKTKMRCIDKAGRHCVTPKTLPDTNTKKYPADLATIVTDRKNIITPGGFGSLEDFLKQSINIEDGRPKIVSELESEIADGRGTYSTIGGRIAAILAASLDWKYVRVVAKNGGQHTTIQSAVNSVSTDNPHLILIMPDGNEYYEEQVLIPQYKNIAFLGLGEVTVKGRIYTVSGEEGFCPYIGNLRIIEGATTPLDIYVKKYSYASIIENVQVYTTSGDAVKIQMGSDFGNPKLIIRNSYFKSEVGKGCVLEAKGLGVIVNHLIEILNCGIESSGVCIEMKVGVVTEYLRLWETVLKTSAENSITKNGTGTANLFMAHCRYNEGPDGVNITCDYGTLDNVSNVLFDTADLEILIG